MTKRNPRPRKYASQAERQAAYRARNVMLEFRAEPKTADNITKIADTLGYPRSDVLLSMVKFALTNHDWARFGLTHKTIPTYKENPTMKPASPAQIAARKRFAQMARSGAFKKATKRKANPISGVNAGEFAMTVNGKTMHRWFNHTSDPWANSHGFNYQLVSNVTKHGAFVKFTKTRAIVAIDEAADGSPVTEKWEIRNLVFYKTNPTKKTVSQKISQLVHEGYPQRQAVAVALSEQRAGKVKRNPIKKMKIEGTETLDRPEGIIVTKAGALKFAKANMRLDLKKAGFVASISEGARGWVINYGKTVKRNPGKVKYRNLATNLKGDQRVGYAVHMADRPSYQAIAWFTKKPDALAVAQEAADRTGKQLAVTRVQNYFGAM